VNEGSKTAVRSLSPGAAFRILGNETRLTILDTLWTTGHAKPMRFGELRRAVGMRDGSQFNYHLGKLLDGGFIEKADGRYGIRHAGVEVVWAVRSGYLNDHPEIAPFGTTGACFECDGSLQARYTDEMFFVECSACSQLHSLGWFPPGALVGRTPEEALLAYERVARSATALAAAGVCPRCNGLMERTLARDWSEVPVDSPYFDPDRDGAFAAWFVCDRCDLWAAYNAGEAVLDHPAVVGLYREHGIDLRTRPRWELPWLIDESSLHVLSEDPFRVRVTVGLEGDEIRLTLDEAFEVVDVE
jgi:DNA-binding transcriptional ArsR family regulator